MKELLSLSITEAKERMTRGEFTSEELTKSYLQQIDEKNDDINAFITVTHDLAVEQAKASDKKIREKTSGLIEGIPIGVKDMFCTYGVKTTAASRMLGNFIPYYESTVTRLLRENGGVTVGKTNMDEFAMGSANLNSYFGPVKNPWKKNNDDAILVPGGSSGGSAAAVAAGMCLGALGSDTGGSVRQPAAFCGVVGVKPTYGRCSRYGMVGFASSLDQAGVFGGCVEDAALLLESICGYDSKDSTSANIKTPEWFKDIKTPIKGLRVGIPKEYIADGINSEILAMWDRGKEWLKDAGAEIFEISLPHTKYALPTYYVIAPSEASSNLARYDGIRYGLRIENDEGGVSELISANRSAGFGNEVKRRIMIGTYLLSSGHYDDHYIRAQRVRKLIYKDFIDVFQNIDVILTPTVPSTAFGINEKISDPVTMYLNDIFTVTVNLADLPGISIPAGLSKEGLPIGLQLIGKAYDESTMFNAAYAMQKAAGFRTIRYS